MLNQFMKRLLLRAVALLLLQSLLWQVGMQGVPLMAQTNLLASESTFVSSNDPETNFNGSPLELSYNNFPTFGSVKRVLIKFDLTGVANSLSTASIILNVTNTVIDGASITIGLYQLPDTWSASSVTANSQPASGTLLQTKTVANSFVGEVRFDASAVSTYLDAQRTGDKTASFLLTVESGSGLLLAGSTFFDTLQIVASTTRGDINGDTTVNILDLQVLINMILHGPQPDQALYQLNWWQRADLVTDGSWNILDLQTLINIILSVG